MAFKSYLDYDTYVDLGGTVSEDAFDNLERKAQRWLDTITFNRIPLLPKIPDEVKEVLTEYINKLKDFDNQKLNGEVIKSYSNGIEKIDYRRSTESEIKREMISIARSWLPDYLTARSVSFDVEQYIQSENNDTQ